MFFLGHVGYHNVRRKEKILKKMIEEYRAVASALEKRSKELAEMIKNERDVFALHRLERRKYIIDTERYEVLRDIRDMTEILMREEALYGEAV